MPSAFPAFLLSVSLSLPLPCPTAAASTCLLLLLQIIKSLYSFSSFLDIKFCVHGGYFLLALSREKTSRWKQ